MNHVPIICALSVAILYIMVAAPTWAYSREACIVLGFVLLYFGFRTTEGGRPGLPQEDPNRPLDAGLVARVLENLKREPSEQLHEILAQASGGTWSREALHAARLLLDQRSTKAAPEPVYRTVPREPRDQAARERERVAPGFSRDLLSLDVGSRVYCKWRDQDGTIIRWDDEEERFYIRYDNGEGEWTTLGMFA